MHIKKILIPAISIILILSAFCKSRPSSGKEPNLDYAPVPSTLDSLQGIWINENDTLNKVIIAGRYWNEIYNDPSTPINEMNRLYFSDTIVSTDDFLLAQIDTTALSGGFIIFKSLTDNFIECWEINGFSQIDNDAFFSMWPAPYGTMSSSKVFRKSN